MAARRTAARPVSWQEGSQPGKSRTGLKHMYSRFVALRVRPAGRGVRTATEGPELPERWLLAEWPADEPEPVQFWLPSLPSGMPLATWVRLAKLRWRIEHDYREMNQALGLAPHGVLVVAHSDKQPPRPGRRPTVTTR